MHPALTEKRVEMAFRIGLVSLLVVAAAIVGAVGVSLLVQGRPLPSAAMITTGVVIAIITRATWTWSRQSHPVPGIHI
ncbi:MAG: hypothetical protein AAF467_25345 [Actinomycetota bacterium]